MVWAIDMADSINKILYIRGYANVDAYIKKYSRDSKRISLVDFLKSMTNLGITTFYSEKDIK